jgi:hypothetical protein
LTVGAKPVPGGPTAIDVVATLGLIGLVGAIWWVFS